MSTFKVTALKNPSSSANNIVLNANATFNNGFCAISDGGSGIVVIRYAI